MPKLIELTLQLEIQRVSCPGVWLCQDGRVSLTVYALGTSYQTCLLPPVFPLLFKDIFYFRKRFNQSCALNNMCCMMKDESLYCELVQWCDDCSAGDCVILAQYLGALNDVLFPPLMCSNDGVDLLMRRSKDFPSMDGSGSGPLFVASGGSLYSAVDIYGLMMTIMSVEPNQVPSAGLRPFHLTQQGILSPKIEVATKIRIDEVWNKYPNGAINPSCDCLPEEKIRSKPVCHTAPYHRSKCGSSHRPRSASRSRSQTRSVTSKSCCSLAPKEPVVTCDCPSPQRVENVRSTCGRWQRPCPEYNVYNVKVNGASWVNNDCQSNDDEAGHYETDQFTTPNEDLLTKRIVQSQFIEEKETSKRITVKYPKVSPCICEICKRYHELFHTTAK